MTELEQTRSVVQRPEDFDEFWRATMAELDRTPIAWKRTPSNLTAEGYTVETLEFASLGGVAVYGWIAVPEDAERLSAPGFLWLPGYSHGNPPPGPESLYAGIVTLGLNVHGNLPDTAYVHPSTLGRDYIAEGIDTPQTYVFRAIVAHCLRAFEVLALQPEVDPDRVIAGGMSQGGGLALIVAALRRDATWLCLADMPWLSDLDRALSLIDRERYQKFPQLSVPDKRLIIEQYAEAHPERREEVFRTYRYFDPLSHAGNIACPTQMSAGGRDPSCRPPTIYAVYNEITAEKEMIYLPTTGHQIVPAMHMAHENWVNSH
ncbi:cephalosporin-C deacetylase [Capsulimonas corticalis]|uniref:Cephalosporin-C deacetylase n=1 Tax=Capsulimonas corticalis TaxID=2219043 RepID=A0A402CY78_9BACT|nr:acetylxylan esterase [Capsulimonas corticalis]BDI31440.1 cephalosporin-C deacetylase [Capsulimonas corticalis]